MNYAEMTASTSEMIRRLMLKNTIETAVLSALCMVLIVLMAIMVYQEAKEKKARKRAVWGEYRPTVTETVQYDQFGTEYHRMGVVGREV